jgi:hypothetical protein
MTRKAKVSGAIPARNLSPGLLVRLKTTGSHHRKHPAIIIPEICKLLESEHMPVFKRKGKLFTGPARPCALALNAILADRPAQMVKWIRENPPAKLEGLWLAMLPEGSTAPPQGYAADLFWLLQQGHILLYTDDTLVVQDPPPPQQPKKPKQPKKKAVAAGDPPAPADDSVAPADDSVAPAEVHEASTEVKEPLAVVQEPLAVVQEPLAEVEEPLAVVEEAFPNAEEVPPEISHSLPQEATSPDKPAPEEEPAKDPLP